MAKLSDIKNNKKNTVILGGKECEVSLNMNKLCDLEEKFGSIEKAFDEVQKYKMTAIRTFLHIAIKGNEFLKDSTEEEIGELIEIGDIENIMTAITYAINGTLPEADDTEVNIEDAQGGK